MNINYTLRIEDFDNNLISLGNTSIDLDPNNFLDLDESNLENKIYSLLKEDATKKIHQLRFQVVPIQDNNFKSFNSIIKNTNEENNDKYIYLYQESYKGDRDWYGDFNYGPNTLSKYSSCKKQCECYELEGSGHGYGCAGWVVKTTKEFIEMMGWEDDLKYKCTRDNFLRIKNKYGQNKN